MEASDTGLKEILSNLTGVPKKTYLECASTLNGLQGYVGMPVNKCIQLWESLLNINSLQREG